MFSYWGNIRISGFRKHNGHDYCKEMQKQAYPNNYPAIVILIVISITTVVITYDACAH